MKDSKFSKFYRLSVAERVDELARRGWLTAADVSALRQGFHVLSPQAADKMIENVIASFALPLAIAPNFVVNERDYIVPLVVEEPSIVAGLSNAAKLARDAGGFSATCEESLLIGQIYLSRVDDVSAAAERISAAKDQLVETANAHVEGLRQRGGGVRDIEVHRPAIDNRDDVLAVHLLVDTCDAMGANAVNSLCEALAPDIAALAGGTVGMRILSNLADRSVVTARMQVRLEDLATNGGNAEVVRDAIVLASDIAHADPYRAATHNKGIMNGIDALAIATGNDWRAIEAGAHAFAVSKGRYRALTSWTVGERGDLYGEIRVPLKVGIVGGTLKANPAARLGLNICGVASARELAELMGAVGLAQNYAAIHALASFGIQKGHMRLHARNVAAAAGVPAAMLDAIAAELSNSGAVKESRAKDIVEQTLRQETPAESSAATACGKVILLGEHAVVYGKSALALPIENALRAFAAPADKRLLTVPEWGIRRECLIGTGDKDGIDAAIQLIAEQLEIATRGFDIKVSARIPHAMGLGSSAAFAVAIIRALGEAFALGLDDERVNAVAFECEQLAHGKPSGIDNTLATYGQPLLFRRAESLEVKPLPLSKLPPVIIGFSSTPGLTREQVAAVREKWRRNTARYDALFAEIDTLARQGADAMQAEDYATLGELMNLCQGLLNAMQVSTPELERMVAIARSNGALGAKLTGGGGGGSIVALCPDCVPAVEGALRDAGFGTMRL